ncbi:Fc.00g054230.m01.CDS01 [Cosmosporella sp. VM-42]
MEREEATQNLTPMASRIAREAQVDLVPGTEVMTDIDGLSFYHNSDNPDSVVLIPQPTDDPHDPLNWSTFWKTLVIVNQGIFVIASIVPALSIAPLTPVFMQQWQSSLTEVALLTGVTVMMLGYCNFLIVPSCEIFGRRITLLICAVINLGACIWQATATSYGSFLGARILAGTGASANESIMNIVVTDIYFLHQRGKYVGSYFWCYFMGLFLGPIISGAVQDHASWRVFFWACTGAQGLNIICLLAFFPETRRLRKEQLPPIVETEQISDDNGKLETSSGHAEFVSPTQMRNLQAELVGSGKPSRAQFRIFQDMDRTAWRAVVRHFFTPAYIFFFPIIFWASMSMGSAANALLAVNLLQSPGLAAPPYNFTPAQVGYANFALVGGGVLGLAAAGPWSDYVSQKATERNKGIREPEMRLWSLTPFIAAAIIGLVAFGVGLQNKWPWPAVIIVGFGFVGVQVVAIPTISITYAIDCYRPISGEIMAIATVCKNTFGFGMTYFINDWAVSDGFIPPVMLLMAMTAGITLTLKNGPQGTLILGCSIRYEADNAENGIVHNVTRPSRNESTCRDGVLPEHDPSIDPACYADSMESAESAAAADLPSNIQWATAGTTLGPASHVSPSMHSSTNTNTNTTQTGSLNIDQASNAWGSLPDLDLFDFGGNAYEPSWLVGGGFDINALTSSISATGSPWVYSEVPAHLGQNQANDPLNGAEYPITDNNNSIRDVVRSRWYTWPALETYPYAPTRLENQDKVDEAYRAGLSNRLRPSPPDNVLPSADFLNTCIKLYFAKFQPILPIVHAPSFRPSSENALLLLSICSVGALFVGSASAAARGRGIFMKLNKAILASWEVYLYRGGREALAVAQAVALGQTFGMLSGNTNDLLMTESFHGTVIAWARQAGMFKIRDSLQDSNYRDSEDLETAWRSWSTAEETVRVLLALHIHDSEFATIFHHEPLLRHGSGRLPSCCSDDLFVASTAAQWHSMTKSLQPTTSSSEFHDHALSNSHASMNAYALLAGHLATICEARCATLDDSMIGDFRFRLTSWYEAYSPSVRYPSRDPHCLMVLWHEAFMSLYVSFDLIERVIGREGPSIRDEEFARIRCWVAELEGQRCVVHAMLIYKRLQTLPISAEPAIHVPKALFYAGLVMYCHAKFRSTEAPLGDIDIPELRSNDLGRMSTQSTAEPPTASLRQFDSSTLYNVADLLRRQGHWEVSRRFASILEALIDDLADSTENH